MPPPLVICTRCWFELPAEAFSPDSRNTLRHGCASRCLDCESARDRKPGKQPRPGSRAAAVADMKASGNFREWDADEWAAVHKADAYARKLDGQRQRDRQAELDYLPHRWDYRVRLGHWQQGRWGTPHRETLRLLERWAPILGRAVPPVFYEDLGEYNAADYLRPFTNS